MNNIQEILEKNRKIEEFTNCWLWTARLDQHGYGVISLWNAPKNRHNDFLVHRLSYELFIGPIKNLCLHQPICINKHCFNPEHLYDGTHQDNIIDEVMKGTHKNKYGLTNKTHCQNGHEYSPENVQITSSGARRCKICRDAYNKNNPNKKKYLEDRKLRRRLGISS